MGQADVSDCRDRQAGVIREMRGEKEEKRTEQRVTFRERERERVEYGVKEK